MTTIYPARPTIYNGVQMRSRMEAAFAQHLDHKGVEWEYEPTAFASTVGQYLPDFKVTFENGRTLWAELKRDMDAAAEARSRMEIIQSTYPEARLAVYASNGFPYDRHGWALAWFKSGACEWVSGEQHRADRRATTEARARLAQERASGRGRWADVPYKGPHPLSAAARADAYTQIAQAIYDKKLKDLPPAPLVTDLTFDQARYLLDGVRSGRLTPSHLDNEYRALFGFVTGAQIAHRVIAIYRGCSHPSDQGAVEAFDLAYQLWEDGEDVLLTRAIKDRDGAMGELRCQYGPELGDEVLRELLQIIDGTPS